MGRPCERGFGDLALDFQAVAVGVDPLAELGPAADQGFVGDLNRGRAPGLRVALGCDQAGVGKTADDRLDRHGVGTGRDELAKGSPALGVLVSLSRLCQTEKDPTADLAVGLVELTEDVVGPVLERTLKLAECLVGRDGGAVAPSRLCQSSISVNWSNGRDPG